MPEDIYDEPFRRVIIVGISGTGKSTLSRLMHEKTKIPLFHMDSIIWGNNWQEKVSSEVTREINAITKADEWIVEGWVDQYSTPLLEKSQVILYLDYPGYLAAWGGFKRWASDNGRIRPEMPDGCIEKLNFSFLTTMLFRKERPHIETVLSGINSKKIIRSKSRIHTNNILQELGGRVFR